MPTASTSRTVFYTDHTLGTRGVRITATYEGGAYVELSFDGRPPSEVINVWDYQRNESELPERDPYRLREVLVTWVHEQDTEEATWLQVPVDQVKRVWLRGYLENAAY